MLREDSPSPASPPARPGATRYGLCVAGIRLAFPPGELLEFLPDAPIHRLPLAPSRLVGLVQLRGHPVAVFDFGGTPAPPAGERRPVLVVGEPSRAAALLVDEAPRALVVDEAGQGGDDAQAGDGEQPGDTPAGHVPGRTLERMLGPALRDADGTAWWPVESARLFELLAGEGDPASVVVDGSPGR